jgi:hypothetical protein
MSFKYFGLFQSLDMQLPYDEVAITITDAIIFT